MISNIKAEDLLMLTKNLNILYVEDEGNIRKNTLPIFANLFNIVDSASDGIDGFESYKDKYERDNEFYNIVITDITMPNLNGLSMIKKMQELNPEQIFMIISAHSDSKYLLEAIDLGVNSFLVKPINNIDKVKKALFNVAMSIDNKKTLNKYIDILIQQNLELDKKNKELEKSIRISNTMVKKENFNILKNQAESGNIKEENEYINKKAQIENLVKDDLYELKELLVEMDLNLMNILDSNNMTTKEMVEPLSNLVNKYSSVLGYYSFFIELSQLTHELSINLKNLPEQKFEARNHGGFMLLEQFFYVLKKWHENIEVCNEKNINSYDASLISDLQTINALISENNLEENFMEFF